MNNDATDGIRKLTTDELQQVSGADFNLGPLHIAYSEGCGCIDVGIGDTGIWFGRAGAGWYSGDKAGRL